MPFVSSKSAPTTPKSLLELPEVIDEDLSDGQWKFQPTKMRCSIGFPFLIYHLVAMHDT